MPTSSIRNSSTSTSSPVSSTPRSFLSRLAPSFASKTRSSAEFDIQLDDPHRQYAPGDAVTGTVTLKVLKPLRITHLVISLHGYVQVYKNPNTPGDGYRAHNPSIGSGKGPKKAGYYGNGFATLFEEETVLCGDGSMQKGIFKFQFSLDFPSKTLPSSIDFERGTISYMLTATLTRPTSISPTSTRELRVFLIENIDIGPISEPKPRKISLEPRAAKSKPRQPKKRPPAAKAPETGDAASTSKDSRVGELNIGAKEDLESPRSPAASDVSFETQPSTTTGSGEDPGTSSGSGWQGSGELKSAGLTPIKKQPITATITLLKAGFLRGDTIQLTVNVTHTKYMKSLHGIIVTLYRQARVDMHPALPVITTKDGKMKAEEYFPRSKTGLGGLSLSNSGSTHVFRKDLSQSFAPLIIDPKTLTADVKASVRVPEEAFPSITNVPGAMITFKYYVEVVVDLQAKLASLGRFLPNSGMMNIPNGYEDNSGIRPEVNGPGMFSAWGGNFIDTTQVRRDKSVVACVFGIIVGTRDSERRKNKGKQPTVQPPVVDGPQAQPVQNGNGYEQGEYHHYDESQYYDYGHPPDRNIDHHDHYYGFENQYDGHENHQYDARYGYYPEHQYDMSHPHGYRLPHLAVQDESHLTDKERIRRAEQRLLPSEPPAEGNGESAACAHAPSAPLLTEDEDLLFAPAPRTRSHANSNASTIPPPSPSFLSAGLSAPPVPSAPLPSPRPLRAPAPVYTSSPAHDEASSSRVLAAGPAASDDKQELQRRRLQAEQSAPPAFDPNSSNGPDASAMTEEDEQDAIPTAPDLADLQLGDDAHDTGLPYGEGASSHHDPRAHVQTTPLLPAYRETRAS
ncbi:hypothetical protein EJ05DRAFT_55719 [Pseudovirgaria hyperparasitica]|uniref:Arrestin C-terminal-like domain-containing protein n=1 Tax=Pseudovirgaria hyperparasitica TaxID=470096 RepID=A0A6A6W2E5_9PEZI|nr:uncharacterized protein EJ05DRAFT_55719 [Pseudovirgaria hyperparasitica]KAF2757098.1 hypothetical protein EJ05DRAFT_55719 [Pseudovirgaria hyperparasitica]